MDLNKLICTELMERWLKAGLEIVSESWDEITKSLECMDISLFIFSFSSFLLFLIIFFVLGLQEFHDSLFKWYDGFINESRAKLFNEIINALNCCTFDFIIVILGH